MKLSEIFAQLTYGELSQISLGGADMGQIDEANYAQVIAHINLGMISLYKRFPLKEGTLVLRLQKDKQVYPLTAAYAESNISSREADRHIEDSYDNPFTGDINKIEKVLTDTGYELSLNIEGDRYGCFTPSMQTIRVSPSVLAQNASLPDQYKTDTLSLVYRASPAVIQLGKGTFDPTSVEVELPYSHLEPLLLFVASRVNNPIGMQNEFHAGNSYYAKYEAACQHLEYVNLKVDQGQQSSRLHSNGWV